MDKFQKRISKKARRGFRGWPVATIAFYGPDLSRASKVAVGIVRTEGGQAEDMRTWVSEDTDVRRDPVIGQAVIDFIDHHDVRTVAMGERIIGCPHQEGIDYQGDWCPVCDFWKGRNRLTGKLLS
jgi:hypothetical protein